MREVNRHAILGYSAVELFDLVADVQAYPEFLPWCDSAHILQDEGDLVVARLTLSQGPLQLSFTTRNTLNRPTAISLELIEGPFRSLEGSWTFVPLDPAGAKLQLTLNFEFSNPMKDFAMGFVFEQTCNTLVDAFVERADTIYGGSNDH